MDDEEAKILDKLLKEIFNKSSAKAEKTSSGFKKPGVYQCIEGRWTFVSGTQNWQPSSDGLYFIFNDDPEFYYLGGPIGEPFFKIAENLSGSIKAIIKTFSGNKAPYLTFICVKNMEEIFSKTYEAIPFLVDVATMVAHFAINCPAVRKKDIEKIYEVCPCAKQ